VELTAENTAIVLDSTADYAEGPDRFVNWRIVPLYVRFGDESFRDYVDLSPEEFYARLRSATALPTTSQPTSGDFVSVYEGLGGFGRIYSLHLSSKFSGTFGSACRAAEEAGGGRVRAIDTASASAGIAMLAFAIQRRLDQGTTDEEIEGLIERFKRDAGLIFTVDTLEYLAKGGRIGRARALAGELLNIKPILTIQEGEIVPVKRVRGNQKAFLEFVHTFEEGTEDRPSLRIGIAHADAPERVEALREMVARTRPNGQIEVVTMLGPVVGTHAGPGTVGLFWWHDPG
jgi:DegV family protein with EDD domain